MHGILDQIIEMSAAGLSAEQISVALGLDFETYRWVLYG
jgi:orotate phosphoribosyltransferase-like protein